MDCRAGPCRQLRVAGAAKSIGDATGLVPATVNRALVRLCDMGIVAEITNRKRNRVFGYTAYIAILNRGTELPT